MLPSSLIFNNPSGYYCGVTLHFSYYERDLAHFNIFWNCFFHSFTELSVQVLCPFFLLRGCSYGFVRPLYIFGKLALYGGVNIFSKIAIFFKFMVVFQHRILNFSKANFF